MNLFSYIVMHDGGFSPNPFFGYCTLACCKPDIRWSAEVGDIVVGLTPKGQGHKLVYAMRVTEKLCFKEYWSDKRFQKKKPAQHSTQAKKGDNIYQPIPRGFRQCLRSAHEPEAMQRDLSVKFVLVSNDFVYFGSQSVQLPQQLKDALKVGRGHRKLSAEDATVAVFEKFFQSRQPSGQVGLPTDWESDEKSPPKSCRRCN